MDTAGTGVGVTSLILQLAGGCVQAFSFWGRGKAITEEATIFQVRLEGQAAKFKAWGVGWEIDPGFGSNPTLASDEKFKENGDLVIKYVVIIHQFLDALRNLGSEFPIIKSAEEAPPLSAATLLDRVGDLSDPEAEARREYRQRLQELAQQTTVQERVKWAYQNGGPLKTLELLRDMIEDLYDVFPPPKKDPIAEHVLNALLASLDIAKLERLSRDSESSVLGGLAYLKTMILQMEARNLLLEVDGGVWEKSRHLKDAGPRDETNGRSLAKFREQPVLVEWKSVDSSSGTAHTDMVEQRIALLARLLKAKLKPRELRTLECLGVVRQPGPGDGDISYGMLFATPSATPPRSLHDIVDNSPDEPALGDWLAIAKNAVEAVLFLHMAGWLHKAIRSDNVLFFDAADYSNLRIVGFEYSRQAASAQQTEGTKDDLRFNLYRHPDVQSGLANRQRVPFMARHDVYSLGIVLLEIGLRQTVSSLYRAAAKTLPADADQSGQHFMRHLVEIQVPKLKGSMGNTYCDITCRCLEGSILDDQGKTEPEALYLGVLRPLERLRVD